MSLSPEGGFELCCTALPTGGGQLAHQAVFKFLVSQSILPHQCISLLFTENLAKTPLYYCK